MFFQPFSCRSMTDTSPTMASCTLRTVLRTLWAERPPSTDRLTGRPVAVGRPQCGHVQRWAGTGHQPNPLEETNIQKYTYWNDHNSIREWYGIVLQNVKNGNRPNLLLNCWTGLARPQGTSKTTVKWMSVSAIWPALWNLNLQKWDHVSHLLLFIAA